MKKQTLITTSWDDGHTLDLKLADLLNRYDLPATFYVSPQNRQWSKENLLTDEEIQQLSQNFEIGAHTMTHPELTKVSIAEAKKEIKDSKEYLENLLGTEVPMFCYPRGLFNTQIKKAVKEAGFKGARTTQAFRTNAPTDLFEIGTTHHTVDRSIIKNITYSTLNRGIYISISNKTDWLEFGKASLDIVEKQGGIWHLWGHSWQIEENDWWDKLEELFKYMANKTTFTKITNGEIVTQSNMSNTTYTSY